MAHRYARVDVDFMHKRTAQTLLRELGPGGPLAFIALILRAKDGNPPGMFSYPNDAIGWEKLGLDQVDLGFTLDEFFGLLGRLKQSSRRRNGPVWNVYLTRYQDWQKDAKRYEEAVKKSRTRAHSAGDTSGTPPGTPKGQKGGPSSRSRSTPIPPRRNGTNPRAKGTSPRQTTSSPASYPCPHCTITYHHPDDLNEHLTTDHPAAAPVT